MIILRLEERYIYNGTWSYRTRINQIRPHFKIAPIQNRPNN